MVQKGTEEEKKVIVNNHFGKQKKLTIKRPTSVWTPSNFLVELMT